MDVYALVCKHAMADLHTHTHTAAPMRACTPLQVCTDAVGSRGATYWFPGPHWFGRKVPEAGGQLERTLNATKDDPRKYMASYTVSAPNFGCLQGYRNQMQRCL